MASIEVRQQLQLQVLQRVALCVCLVLPPLILLGTPDSVWHTAMRVGFLVLHVVMYKYATAATAQRLGFVHIVAMYVSPLLRAFSWGDDFVLWSVTFSTNRILPLVAVIYGGRNAALAAGAVTMLTAGGGKIVRMLWNGATTPYGVLTALPSLFTKDEGGMIAGDWYCITASTVLALALDGALTTALAHMSNALSAKQQFITNMVRTTP